MSRRYYTLPLKDSAFPLLSEQSSRTTMRDFNADLTATARPSIYYCHNVMPSNVGINSVGYTSLIPAITPVVTVFSDVRIIFGDALTRLYLAFTSVGDIYVLKQSTYNWIKLGQTAPVSINDITVGTVNGISYIFYSKTSCQIYNETTDTLDPITLTGIDLATTLGIVAASGYLIAYSTTTLAWSSTIDPTDFTPDSATGAGGGNVAAAKGAILFILPNPSGIFIYTETNTVVGEAQSNIQYPFKFTEVAESQGGISLDLVAYESNTASQFVYSKAGMQVVDIQKAKIVLAEITDFLSGKRIEDFDEITKDFSVTDLTDTMLKKIKFIASRYVVISYGATEFTHALVYDTALQRLGKLKITHVDVFEYIAEQTEIARESFAFLLASGEVKVVDFSVTAPNAIGVVVLGKLQYVHGRIITLQMADVENIDQDAIFSASTFASFDGKSMPTLVSGTELYREQNIRKIGFLSSALNHSLLFIGKFNLTTVFITYSISGSS